MAIVGCGKIADQHVLAIQRIAGARVVAVCDHEPLMAGQLGERFGVGARFADTGALLRAVAPDVVHITTPPQSHLALGRQCLEAGAHVYLEKPFTINTREAEDLFALAGSLRLQITAGHNYQFTLEMMEMRRLVAENYLGGRPVHLESYWPYNLGEASYARPVLGSASHWVRQLPGRLYHNLISHGIARLAEFLDDDLVEIKAFSHQSPALRSSGAGELQDELRVFIRDRSGTTALFCFSTQIKPGLNLLRVLGPSRSLVVDQTSGSFLREELGANKSYLTYVIPQLRRARQQVRSAWDNIIKIAARRLYQDGGMKELIEAFYSSVRRGGPPPIPPREIILTTRIMDEIFDQIYPSNPGAPSAPLERRRDG